MSTRRRGQSTLEYAVVIAVVTAALLGMQFFMKRGVQGRLRSATDDIGEQYVPGQVVADHTVHSDSDRHETLLTTGESQSTLNDAGETQTRYGKETVTTSDTLWKQGR